METALQVTQLLTNIIVITLFAGILFVLISLVKYVKKLSVKVDSFSKDLSEVKPKLFETIDKVNFLADSLTIVTKNVNNNIDVLGTVVDKVKDTADSIIEFEQKIQNTVEPPVMDTLNTITAVSIGVKTFFDRLKESRSDKLVEPEDFHDNDSSEFDESDEFDDYDSSIDNDNIDNNDNIDDIDENSENSEGKESLKQDSGQ